MTKKVDLRQFAENISDDDLLRRIFYNDYDLQRFLLLLNNHNPSSLSLMTKEWNNIFKRDNDKRFISNKINKIDKFGLIQSKTINECKNHEDNFILDAHKKYLEEIPPALHSVYKNMRYYYLTEKGNDWVDVVAEQLKKRIENKQKLK